LDEKRLDKGIYKILNNGMDLELVEDNGSIAAAAVKPSLRQGGNTTAMIECQLPEGEYGNHAAFGLVSESYHG
jgi:hypothetical protein